MSCATGKSVVGGGLWEPNRKIVSLLVTRTYLTFSYLINCGKERSVHRASKEVQLRQFEFAQIKPFVEEP